MNLWSVLGSIPVELKSRFDTACTLVSHKSASELFLKMHYSVIMDRSCDSAQFGYENSIDIETGEIKYEADRNISCSLDSLDLRIAAMETRKIHNKLESKNRRGIPRQTSRDKLKQKSDELKRNLQKVCDDLSYLWKKMGRNYRFM